MEPKPGIDNKNSFFQVKIQLPETGIESLSSWQLKLENQMDEVLAQIKAGEEVYIMKDERQPNRVDYYFRTMQRKRIGQLRNLLDKKLDERILKSTKAHLKKSFYSNIDECIKKGYIKVDDRLRYKGKDIEHFKDRSNWYQWQNKLYNLLYDKDGKIKEADDREILFIEDEEGNSGKSSFIKWLYLNSNDEIAFLTDGTASQLKASITSIGVKKAYIIDLPRTENSKESMQGLMIACEMLKNGVIASSMYGAGKTLVMCNPWVILTGNALPLGSFSVDRWQVWELQRTKNDCKAIDITDKSRELAKAHIAIKKEERKLKQKAMLKEYYRITGKKS